MVGEFLKCIPSNSFVSPYLLCSGAEQGAQGADTEAGLWAAGQGSGHQRASDGGGGPGGAAGVSPGGEGRLQQAIAASARPQSPL